jgi:hypothetical protein
MESGPQTVPVQCFLFSRLPQMMRVSPLPTLRTPHLPHTPRASPCSTPNHTEVSGTPFALYVLVFPRLTLIILALCTCYVHVHHPTHRSPLPAIHSRSPTEPATPCSLKNSPTQPSSPNSRAPPCTAVHSCPAPPESTPIEPDLPLFFQNSWESTRFAMDQSPCGTP